MYAGLTALLLEFQTQLPSVVLVFMRIGAIAALLPGFGEQMIPARVRLAIALCFTAVVWPAVVQELPPTPTNLVAFSGPMLIETGIGLLIGLSARLLVMALQLAGSIAAQSTSVAQIFGAGATPDPMPAIGNLLVLGGLALVMAGGLHVKAAFAMIESYRFLPFAQTPAPAEVMAWGIASVSHAFALAFSLAAPFLVASFAYNLALGAINRAMPSLMVAFIGAPAITAGGIMLLAVTGTVILTVWSGKLDFVLQHPMSVP